MPISDSFMELNFFAGEHSQHSPSVDAMTHSHEIGKGADDSCGGIILRTDVSHSNKNVLTIVDSDDEY